MALDSKTVGLLQAVVASSGSELSDRVSVLSRQVTNWQEVIESARQHGLLPILSSRLSEHRDSVPDSVLQELRHEYERNAFHCIANAAELHRILLDLGEAGIRAVPFKGVVLATSAYGDLNARNAGDLDILVSQDDLQLAAKILRGRGYLLTTAVRDDGLPESDNYFELHFERPSDGMVAELRWRLELTQPRFRKVLGLDWAWSHHTTVSLAGADVQSLDPIATMLMLCMHGSKHMWSRLMWVCDVARLIESQPQLDWPSIRQEAKRTDLQHPLALGVLLAKYVTDAKIPPAILRGFENSGTIRHLAEFIAEHIFEQPGSLPQSRVPYYIQLLSLRDRAAAVLSPSFLRPNAQDRALIKLPPSLDALYYVVRPIRILIDRSGR